jgi:hypothetical protein
VAQPVIGSEVLDLPESIWWGTLIFAGLITNSPCHSLLIVDCVNRRITASDLSQFGQATTSIRPKEVDLNLSILSAAITPRSFDSWSLARPQDLVTCLHRQYRWEELPGFKEHSLHLAESPSTKTFVTGKDQRSRRNQHPYDPVQLTTLNQQLSYFSILQQ